MTSKTEIKNRYWILHQFNEAPNDEICLTGYLNINPKSNWVTFTQIENETGKRIAGHLNFPIHKVKEVFENYKEFKDIYSLKKFSNSDEKAWILGDK